MKLLEMKDDEIMVGHKIKIFDIPDELKEKLYNFMGLSDYVQNWAKDVIEEDIRSQGFDPHSKKHYPKILSQFTLKKIFIEERKSNPELSFLKKMPIGIAVRAMMNAIDAFKRFYKFGLNSGYPHYRSKKRDRNRFGVRNDNCYIENGYLKIEGFKKGIKFDIKTHNFDGYGIKVGQKLDVPIYNPVVSFDGDNFYFSFTNIEKIEETDDFDDMSDAIGIDLGIRNTFMISDGRVFQQPDCSRIEKHISGISSEISKRENKRRRKARKERTNLSNIPKSKTQLKLETKRRNLYKKIHHKKTYFYHNVTTTLLREKHKAIVIEKILVQDVMRKSPHIKKEISQTYFATIRKMFEYKAIRYDKLLIEANCNYPSTKTCSHCGELNQKIGSKRTFTCPTCGTVIDRDLNAALNLKGLYDEYLDGNYSNIDFSWEESYV
jgi:putative transposase